MLLCNLEKDSTMPELFSFDYIHTVATIGHTFREQEKSQVNYTNQAGFSLHSTKQGFRLNTFSKFTTKLENTEETPTAAPLMTDAK